MAEVHRIGNVAAVQEALDQVDAYKEMLEREAAMRAEIEARNAAGEAAIQTQIGAFVEAAFLVASADGSYSENEATRLVERVSALTRDKIGADRIAIMAGEAHLRVSEEGRDARFHALAEILPDPELRQAALLVASSVGYLDGGVGQKEGLALQSLARSFGFSIDELHKLMAKAHG